jgi:hypothetical protein
VAPFKRRLEEAADFSSRAQKGFFLDKINVNALFLGPKSEHGDFFMQVLAFMMNDHIDWRKYFHPDDKAAITEEEKSSREYQATLQKAREALVDLAAKLQIRSMPWFSPRYLGHMCTVTLLAANLAYMLTLLHCLNNCAYGGSPATTSSSRFIRWSCSRASGPCCGAPGKPEAPRPTSSSSTTWSSTRFATT